MVVIEMMLYQKLSPMVNPGCTWFSNKKKVKALPTTLMQRIINMAKIPRTFLLRIRRIILVMVNIIR